MKTLQINLGLNNNPMNREEIVLYFATLKNYRLMAYYFKNMEFNGQIEPTFVAMLEYKYTRQSKVLTDVENWCSLFTQESIAFVTQYMESLAFNVSFVEQPYKFDSSLFEYVKIFDKVN